MLVIAPSGKQAFWLPDRKSALDREGETARVILVGDNRRMLASHANQEGHLYLDRTTAHDGRTLTPGSIEADAYAILTDRRAMAEVLYPPYIGDTMKRPHAEHLRDPIYTLSNREIIIVHQQRRIVVWIEDRPCDFGHDLSFGAPILPRGSVAWEHADRLDKWPAGYQRDLWPLAESLWALSTRDGEKW
ncbi:hypothetical protein ABZ897_53730 [Nonomuraea sp. NPDC046802]|uniref:hypothetical protein n=1 Tax=Nonomuraea sp. NPDC046802 TaxID=3154919 RepID=UPI0033CE87A1